MTKEQILDFLKAMKANGEKEAVGNSEYEKAISEHSIQAERTRFSGTLRKALYFLPIEKYKEMSKFFTESEKLSAREGTIRSYRQKFIDTGKVDKNSVSNEFNAYKDGFYKSDYDRYKNLIGKYLSKEEFEDALTKIGAAHKREGGFINYFNFRNAITDAIMAKGLIKESEVRELKNEIAHTGVPTTEEIINASNFISKEEFETNPDLYPEISLNEAVLRGHADEFINYVAENLTEKQFDDLVEYSKTQGSILNRSDKEISVPKYAKEIDAIRKSGVTKEQEDSLKFIEEYMVDTDSKFDSEISSYRTGIEVALKKDEDNRTKDYMIKENLNDVVVDKKVVYTENGSDVLKIDYQVFNEQKSPDIIEKYKNMEMQFSKETEKAFVNIINKMNEYGIITDELVPEQGSKIYGLHQYAKTALEIEQALKNGEKEKLPDLVEQNKNNMKHYDEIIALIEDTMPVKEGNLAYVGNMDVERVKLFPPKYRRKIAAISVFNAMYLTGSFLKEKQIKPENYIKNPKKYVTDSFKNYYEATRQKPENYKGKSTGELFFDMMTDRTKKIPNTMEFIRVMENMSDIEKDPELRNHNKAVYLNYQEEGRAFGAFVSQSNNYLSTSVPLMEKILIVPDDQRSYALDDKQCYDPISMKFVQNKPFDDMTYIENNEINIKELNDKIERTIKDYTKNVFEMYSKDKDYFPNLSIAKVVKACHNIATKVTMVKPEEKNNPEYAKLMKFVNDPQKIANELTNKEINFDNIKLFDSKKLKKDTSTFVKKQLKQPNGFMQEEFNRILKEDNAINQSLKNLSQEELIDWKDGINSRIEELKDNFEKGLITEEYFNARTEQLKNRDFKSPLPVLKDDVTKDKELNELLKGKTGADLDKYSQKIEDRINELTDRFRKGAVTENYYNERVAQLKNKDFNSPLPAMFKIDKMPALKDWAKQNGIDDLPKSDQQLAYDSAKERAMQEKESFLQRRYLRNRGLINSKVFTLEEIDPELKGANKIVSDGVKFVTNEDIKKAEDARKFKPKEDELGEKVHIDIEGKNEVKTKIVKEKKATILEKGLKNIK